MDVVFDVKLEIDPLCAWFGLIENGFMVLNDLLVFLTRQLFCRYSKDNLLFNINVDWSHISFMIRVDKYGWLATQRVLAKL